MTASSECTAMVRQFEGFAEQAYADGNYYSIGYGHHGPEVAVGLKLTEVEAVALLVVDLAEVAAEVQQGLRVRVTQSQFDALVSLAYNIGSYALKKSTLLRLLNAGDYGKAADQFLRWNKVAGRPSTGLTRRRETERLLFLSQGVP